MDTRQHIELNEADISTPTSVHLSGWRWAVVKVLCKMLRAITQNRDGDLIIYDQE